MNQAEIVLQQFVQRGSSSNPFDAFSKTKWLGDKHTKAITAPAPRTKQRSTRRKKH